MTLYKRFSGSDPGIEAMMRRDGIQSITIKEDE